MLDGLLLPGAFLPAAEDAGLMPALDDWVLGESLRQVALWGAGFIAGIAMIIALKIWYFIELQRIAISHQIKRLEFQIAQLAAEVRKALETR